jgi:transglutaminase-like putative cysteine protease
MQFSRLHALNIVWAGFGLWLCASHGWAQTSRPSSARNYGSPRAAGRYTIAPPPAWALRETPAPATLQQRSDAREGAVYLLSDQQVRVTGQTPAQGRVERYFHHIHEVVTTSGIEHVSQLELEFDPTYQRLVIHRIQIRRGNQTLNALQPAEIRLLQKEDEMEQRLFNGTLAALVILNDVRVGDVVDYDYSLLGDNPILGGRFAEVSYLIEAEPVAWLRYRLLWPTARTLQQQTRNSELQPRQQTLGGVTEYIWERTNLPAPELDSAATLPVDELPALYLSEFNSWQAVAAWAAPLYRVPGTPAPALRQQIELWRQQAPEDQLLAALRFVQDEIRYLGIELGPHSHLPHPPAQVLARRYGDCKDKALLLATILGALGLEAYPALVNTDLLGRVGEVLPSPYAFDHVITVVNFNGQTYWFDPTVSLQRGALAQHSNPEFGRALLVRADTQALTEIPLTPPTHPLKTVKEVYTVNSDNQSATLEVVSVYRGVEADTLRDYLANNSLKDLVMERLQHWHERDRGISTDALPQVKDDPVGNTILLTERYQVARFWREGARDFEANRITQELPFFNPETPKPIRLTFPLDIEHQIEIRTPVRLTATELNESVLNDALQFDMRRTREGRMIKFSSRLRTLRAHIEATGANQLAQAIERIEDLSRFRLSNQIHARDIIDGRLVFAGALLLSLPLLAFVAYKVRQAQRQAKLRAEPEIQLSLPLPGSAPSYPLRVADEAVLAERLVALRCECGGGYRLPPQAAARESVIYDGKRLTLVPLHCAVCEQPRDVYFECSGATTISYAATTKVAK